MASLASFIKRVRKKSSFCQKNTNPLRFGCLGAARIAPDALLQPALYHEDVIVVAVAARSAQRATTFGKQWGIAKTYGGPDAYERLVNDPDVDAIYNPLPNSLHFEWTLKALAAGKHVLCEKPMADTAEEARAMFNLAEEKGLILLEAWQPQFHPAIHRVKAIVDEGLLGKIVSLHAYIGVWGWLFFIKNDIRFNYDLGGGALMDMGPYPINLMRYITSSSPTVERSFAITRSQDIDRLTDTDLIYGENIPAKMVLDSDMDGWGPFNLLPRMPKTVLRITCERGTVEIHNFVLPHIWHSITVIPKNGHSWTEKAYKPTEGRGEEWWSAYRFQLEAFVDKVRGRDPRCWRTPEESIDEMRIIDEIYTKAGLPLRPQSDFSL
ncbi:hypothetical protein HGRIS_003448 [Hohenbuehelia grisea]|uniref:D-xylose 1-dehydrogenase (NADP(+), D-xylono-1,5-lactone-forming) n=1 Tax=Hohenbuehelia grisea TaxID=104357 RepID=A0ABR3JFI4_9AGAR